MTPASIRNRNPGAMYPGPSAKKFGSTSFETLKSKDGVHKIATFPTNTHGAAALFDLLHEGRDTLKRLRYRDKTLRKAIETWCGGYYLPTYLKVLTSHCDVAADDVLSTDLLRDPQRAIPLAKAMALQEAGTAFPLDDHGWLQAHEMAFAHAVEAPGWTPKNDVPTRNPEDKRDAALSLAGKAVAVAGTGSAAAAPFIPAVPPAVTDTMINVANWTKLATSFNPYVVGFGLITCAAVMGILSVVRR